MVVDIGEHDAVARLVDDNPEIAIDAHRPEVRVLGSVDPVELQAGPVRIGLQVERRQLDLLLFVIGELGERSSKAVSEDSGHQQFTLNASVFRNSSKAIGSGRDNQTLSIDTNCILGLTKIR
ncbi:hypothetical protein [Rhizobium ruizarguesonis]|uniref:hypothetical protein n=1 Tax=Rhizobium ruizarguesonis TaxID=2081791 RepID=UPI001FDFB80F|nr:hypothetical protein [Rhizobium ruizarguesonis]